MNCKHSIAAPAARTGMIAAAVLLVATLALRSNKLGPTAPGDALVRAQLSNPGAAHPLLIRGRVVAEPQRRSRATVRLLVKLEAIQAVAGEQWLPAQEVVGVDVYTRGRNGRKGDISADLPALVQSDAYGDRIEAAVHWRQARAGHRQPRLCGYWKRVKIIERNSGHTVMGLILSFKSRVRRTYESRLPDPVYRLAVGAVLGDRGPTLCGSYRGCKITTLFQRAGIGHVLAVSGLHVGILAGGLTLLLQRLRVPPRFRLLPVAAVLFAYMLMTGARPATMRAVLMTTVALASHSFCKTNGRGSAWNGLAVSAALLLSWCPQLLFDVGFQLSYGAVLSLLLLTGPVTKALEQRGMAGCLSLLGLLVVSGVAVTRWADAIWTPQGIVVAVLLWSCTLRGAAVADRRYLPHLHPFARVPSPVRTLIAAQFAIQLGMVLPLGSLHFGHVSLAGTVVNLLAIPLIAIFVQAALLAGLLSPIPLVGHILAWLPEKVTTASGLVFFEIAHAGAEALPCPSVPTPSLALLIVWYAAISVVFFGRRSFAALVRHILADLHPPAVVTKTQEVQA